MSAASSDSDTIRGLALERADWGELAPETTMAASVEVFRRQFTALFVKNWIVLSKHPYVRLISWSFYLCCVWWY